MRKKYLSKALLAFMALVILSCSAPKNRKYVYTSEAFNDTNSGIVVGQAIDVADHQEGRTPLTFINITTHETIEYPYTNLFCFRAPEGTYILDSVHDAIRSYSSQTPFSFQIRAGEKIYIGTLVVPYGGLAFGNSHGALWVLASEFSKDLPGHWLASQEVRTRFNIAMKQIVTSKNYVEYNIDSKKNRRFDSRPYTLYIADNSVELKNQFRGKIKELQVDDFQVRIMK